MSQDIISKKTRNEFREYLVSWTLREIEKEFDSADVSVDADFRPPVTGQRRSLVEKYYHSVDWASWSDVQKILAVYESVLVKLEQQQSGFSPLITIQWAEKDYKNLKKWLEKDGFIYTNGKLMAEGKDPSLRLVVETATGLDAPGLHRQIERLKGSVDDDPDLAIGTAKELIETTCKTILEERGIPFEESDDISKLVKETRKVLGLVPDNIPEAAKGAETIRRLLNNLGNLVQGLAELRNLYGTGHGKAGKSKGLLPRHARLAVGAASTLVTFLFDTHKGRGA
jgi:hypothetical protein